MDYRFREMTINDINDIVKGEEKVFGHSLGYDLIYSDLTINPYACYIVLEIDGSIHGYFGLWITDNVEIINLSDIPKVLKDRYIDLFEYIKSNVQDYLQEKKTKSNEKLKLFI